MKQARMKELMERLARVRIAVVGDLFLDRWLTIDPNLDEPSLETGLEAWQVVGERCSAGAAGTVLNNLAALGIGKLYAISLVGRDGAGWEVKEALTRRQIDIHMVLESPRMVTPQYIKPMRMRGGGPPVEGHRMDVKNWHPTPEKLQGMLINNLETIAESVDAVIILDQLEIENTGVVTVSVRHALKALARKYPKLLLYADSRAFIHQFREVVIKCNNREAAFMTTGREPDAVFDARQVFAHMEQLEARTGRPVYVTCNAHGVAIKQEEERLLIPAVRQAGPIDVCGAGDACTAGIVSALCVGATPAEAAFFGNLTAGVTVRKLGDTGTANRDEVLTLYREQFGADQA